MNQSFAKALELELFKTRDGAALRAFAPYQCDPGSNPNFDTTCGLSLLLVLSFTPRGFSPGSPVFLSPEKPQFPNVYFRKYPSSPPPPPHPRYGGHFYFRPPPNLWNFHSRGCLSNPVYSLMLHYPIMRNLIVSAIKWGKKSFFSC